VSRWPKDVWLRFDPADGGDEPPGGGDAFAGLAGEHNVVAPVGFSQPDLLLQGQRRMGNSPRWALGGGEHRS
jgi:hypothetical protein